MSDSAQLAVQLRQWSADATAVFNGWSGTTYSATKDAQFKELFRRLGIFMDNVAEHLDHWGLNT